MATTNSKFLVKNGLAVAGATGAIDVINTSGQWIGATGTLSGATGPAGATGTSGDRYLTTSTTSFTLADTGSQTVTVGTGLAYSANQTIILTYDASNHQHGRVTSYNSGTGSLTFDKYDYQGSGTYASWTVNLDGAVGAQGASGVQGASGANASTTWSIKTTTYTAVAGDLIVADTTTGAFTITLPATPSTGASISIADGGNWATNNLTIARNGSTIEGLAENLVVDIGNIILTLVYDGTTWEPFASVSPIGASGVSGTNGASGIQGASGATGVQGASGVSGTNGASGVQGASGIQGASGATGLTGATGVAGIDGATGVAGIDGATGPQGIQGASGSTGLTGATGTQGIGGATGEQGVQGIQGIQGASGTQGASGIQGASGSTGAEGAAGSTGPTGTNGINGATGPTGATGGVAATGATGYVGALYATNQVIIGATSWSSFASPLGATGSLIVAGPMAATNHITTPQLLVGNYGYTGLGATGATGMIIANQLKLVSGGAGSNITFSDGTTLASGTPSGYINGPISGFQLAIGATGNMQPTGATGTAWFGNQIYVGPQGSTGPQWGATGTVTTTNVISYGAMHVGTWGATSALGATGAMISESAAIGGTRGATGYKLDVAGNFKVSGSIDENVYAVVDAAGVALSPQNGTIQTWTLGANRTPTQGTWEAGESMTLMINDGTLYTITWTTLGVTWVGGSAPALATTGFTVIQLWKVSTTIYGATVGSVA